MKVPKGAENKDDVGQGKEGKKYGEDGIGAASRTDDDEEAVDPICNCKEQGGACTNQPVPGAAKDDPDKSEYARQSP